MNEAKARKYDPIAVSPYSTVVAEYVADEASEVTYQSEAALERDFIKQLESQAYEYLPIKNDADLVANLRTQLEKLNDTSFSDAEWERFFRDCIAGANDGIVEKTVRIQEDPVQLLKRDDGTTKNITLIDKKNIHNNSLQVINQYAVSGDEGARYDNRYDVTILVNGLPMVHVELKRRGVALREAFNQIDRYQRDSFWAGSGLFEYVQLFVISNGTHTKYYSNTTRREHLDGSGRRNRSKKTSNSFEFTSWWADATNKPIMDLVPFAKTFFAKHALLNILTKYCVLTKDRSLMVMRPYQIVATERILTKILVSTNYKQLGTVQAGGYVWHTTGSGKTLTSFKTAQLAAKLPEVDRVLFVVDRKDLDYQTMAEYERFSPGSVNGSKDTRQLTKQLTSPVGAVLSKRGSETIVNQKISVTTIQKLSNFIAGNKGHKAFEGHTVIIFDECHRSQFGDMHTLITKAFKNYNLFGFTGTPIFSANAGSGGNPQLRTTEQAFGEKLHTYTIVDAITDKNVLPFRIDYINTIQSGVLEDKEVSAIDTEKALLDPRRISNVVDYILEHFDQKTRRNEHYTVQDRRLQGFNSLFATASIDAARRYYNQFQLAQADRTPDQKLKIGLIYSFAPNPDADTVDGMLAEESFDPEKLSGDYGSLRAEAQATEGTTGSLGVDAVVDHRTFLEQAIQDYDEMFGRSYDTSAEGFQKYYKDVSMRLKSRELDLVIVVNMFLTGFDATTLNTLWVDKNLKSHGLIQAFSRTNRILNKVKTYGNIVSFRNLEEATNDAIALFGNKEAQGIVTLLPYEEYYQEYSAKVDDLLRDYPLGGHIIGEGAQKEFIALFGAILRLQNILVSFDQFLGAKLLTDRQFQEYQSRYLDLHNEFRRGLESEKEDINDDVIFEIELIKQVEINVDYILMLVQKYREERGDGQDKEVRAEISRALDASPTLRSKKDLIEGFVDSVSANGNVDEQWRNYIDARQEVELDEIITSEGLKVEETQEFLDRAFQDGALRTGGTAIMKVLPPVSRFTKGQEHGVKKRRVIEKLTAFFNRFFALR